MPSLLEDAGSSLGVTSQSGGGGGLVNNAGVGRSRRMQSEIQRFQLCMYIER